MFSWADTGKETKVKAAYSPTARDNLVTFQSLPRALSMDMLVPLDFFFLAIPPSRQHFPDQGYNHAPCNGGTESQPLNCPGSPLFGLSTLLVSLGESDPLSTPLPPAPHLRVHSFVSSGCFLGRPTLPCLAGRSLSPGPGCYPVGGERSVCP